MSVIANRVAEARKHQQWRPDPYCTTAELIHLASLPLTAPFFHDPDLLGGEAVEAVDDLVDEGVGEAQALFDRPEFGQATFVSLPKLGHELVGELPPDPALVAGLKL